MNPDKSFFFSIGEVSRIKGVPIKTLRFYDKIGLLKPAYTDPETNYRYYGIDQFLPLEMIMLYKQSGASLKEIQRVILEENSTEIAEFCVQQIQNAEEKIADLQDSIHRFQQLIARVYQDKARSVNHDIEYRRMLARTVVSRPCTTPPTDKNTYTVYMEVYNTIRRNRLSTILSTGSEVDLDLDSLQIRYKKMFVEAEFRSESLFVSMERLPAGEYLCVDYFENNKEEQLKKLADEIRKEDLHPKAFYQMDTFLHVSHYVDPMMEMQVLLEA